MADTKGAKTTQSKGRRPGKKIVEGARIVVNPATRPTTAQKPFDKVPKRPSKPPTKKKKS